MPDKGADDDGLLDGSGVDVGYVGSRGCPVRTGLRSWDGAAMTDPQSDQVREQLRQAVVIMRPYAMSSGPFHDPDDLNEAITLSMHCLERAKKLLGRP
jgi:hypothetical protein